MGAQTELPQYPIRCGLSRAKAVDDSEVLDTSRYNGAGLIVSRLGGAARRTT